MSQILFDVTAIVNVIASHCRCCPSKPLFVVLSHALCSIAPIAYVIGTTVMADTLGNIETQEIESINVMHMDTPISFEEVMPGDASNDAEEMNIQPCLGLEFESLEKSLVEKFEEEGLPTRKVASIFNNGDSSFSNKDCWNHIRNLRRKNLDIGRC
ncbi:hypothetical protein D0Y65_015666 [Glycine soja]|uniref:Uncharacterized protein n=1 Tax=Glycine soja TaxID=3848 RepID=A0A445KDY2_GLYSO|nr:hypothetical protein D0Y65_015666 [Glycine soja]